MAGREDEAVAVRPVGIRRVVAHHVPVEQVRERRERHRGARMAGVRLLHRVHRERADRVDRALLDVRRRRPWSNDMPLPAFAAARTLGRRPRLLPPTRKRDHTGRRACAARYREHAPHRPCSRCRRSGAGGRACLGSGRGRAHTEPARDVAAPGAQQDPHLPRLAPARRLHPRCPAAADAHAVSMGRLGYFSHTSADGTSFDRRIARFYSKTAYRSWMVGENLLFSSGHISSGEAVAMWLESPDHRPQHPRAPLEVDRDRRGLHPARRGRFEGEDVIAPRHRLRRPLLGPALPALRRHAYPVGMAVLIASSLRKELSGEPLFDGVSFKVERRDRLALAGPNGAGKTTLLRALIGETELHGRRARVGEGRARRAARPAPAPRELAVAARVRALGRRPI